MSTYHVPLRRWHGHRVGPMTRMGWWAVALALASGLGWLVVLPVAAFGSTGEWMPWGILLVLGGIPAFAGAIAAPILAFVAMARRGERAVSVYLGYVPVACIVASSAINSWFFSG